MTVQSQASTGQCGTAPRIMSVAMAVRRNLILTVRFAFDVSTHLANGISTGDVAVRRPQRFYAPYLLRSEDFRGPTKNFAASEFTTHRPLVGEMGALSTQTKCSIGTRQARQSPPSRS